MNLDKHDLVDELMLARENWKRQDFIDAYNDEWDEVPEDLSDCFSKMEEYIYHTYDEDLIKDCIENEIDAKDCAIGEDDVRHVAEYLKLNPEKITKEVINYVINHFDSEAERDPTGYWEVWIENILLDELELEQEKKVEPENIKKTYKLRVQVMEFVEGKDLGERVCTTFIPVKIDTREEAEKIAREIRDNFINP